MTTATRQSQGGGVERQVRRTKKRKKTSETSLLLSFLFDFDIIRPRRSLVVARLHFPSRGPMSSVHVLCSRTKSSGNEGQEGRRDGGR